MNNEKEKEISGSGSLVIKLFPEDVERYSKKAAELGLEGKQVEPNPTARGGFIFYEVSGDRRLIQKIYEPLTPPQEPESSSPTPEK